MLKTVQRRLRWAIHLPQRSNTKLLGLTGISCAVGATGPGWLWYRWQTTMSGSRARSSCEFPGAFSSSPASLLPQAIPVNAPTGFANTLINIYTARQGTIVRHRHNHRRGDGNMPGVTALLFLLYSDRLHQMENVDLKKRSRLHMAATSNNVLLPEPVANG
jgi:hypothetical protein